MKKLIPLDANLIPPEAERVFRGQIFDVYQWQQEMFDGSRAIYEGLYRPDTVNIIGVVEGNIILVEDTQPHKGTTIQLPGGRVDLADTSTLEAAQREMREETGYEFASWRLVEVVKPTPKMEYFIYIYLATQPSAAGQQVLDAGGEHITLLPSTYDEALERWRGDYGAAIESIFFQRVGSLENLLALPEFVGREVDIPVKD